MGKMKVVDIQPAEHIEYPKWTQTDESHLQQEIKGQFLYYVFVNCEISDGFTGVVGGGDHPLPKEHKSHVGGDEYLILSVI